MNLLKNIIFDLHGVLFEYKLNENSNKFKVIQEGYNILNEFKSTNKYNLYVCTNWSNNIIKILKEDFGEIMETFAGIVNPCQAGAKKPNHKIFLHLFKTYNLIPEECMLIDDKEKNIEAANQIGMKTIYVDNFDYVEKQVKKYLT